MLPGCGAINLHCAGSASSSASINRHEFPGKRLAIAPPPDVSMARMKIFRTAANTIASQNASATQSAAQPPFSLPYSRRKGPCRAADSTIQQARAAKVPAAVLPQNPLTLLKDTAKSPAVLQIPQQAGMGQNPTMRIGRRRQYCYCSSF